MKNNNTYHVVGLMSGTSLDGLDLAYCTFQKESGQWTFTLLDCDTMEYPDKLKGKLKGSMAMSGLELVQLDNDLAIYFAHCINNFKKDKTIDFIASHGHTVFHQPLKGLTLQIGNGLLLSELTLLPVVYDFRSLDVMRGGQGAPLVPVADKHLFGQYSHCLNLGGIANISFEAKLGRIAFDVAPCNLLLNHLASKVNLEYDNNGELASKGTVISEVLEKWNSLDYFSMNHPKSMGYEYVRDYYLPDLDSKKYKLEDLLNTSVEHMACQISKALTSAKEKAVLATGGGAKNKYLIKRIRSYLSKDTQLIIPQAELIDFKEAIAFGFLGVLKVRNEINILSSVTGASCNSSSGIMIGF